ncbi:MAG: Na-K-Cl cotransporter, partial [Bacteroidota bacterium]
MVKAKKFGAISGVFTPSILTILGVIMYLRLPWIVGQAGLWATIGIILVAHIISFTTGLSVASIATDKKIETGGSYYIISRSLGLPIGGTLGLALFVGLSFSVSLYLIGFAEVFLGIFGFEVTINNIRITGAVVLALLTILTFISTSLVIKAQYIILIAIVLSLLSIMFGNHEHTPEVPLFDSMGDSLSWIALFAIFFPAVTGFEAGVSMSGDLKDPRKNIPIGTIAAVLTGLLVYIGLAFFLSYSVDRELLVNDPSVLFIISWIPQLVIAGILGATLSSALGSILGAPRILQATAIDRITPVVFGKGFGASNEPRNALLLTFAIALSGILIGELNVIARIVTIFFIITYGFLNITYAVESWAGTDFRPTFRIPGFISIIGAITCIVVMIQLDIVAMIGASLLLIAVFLYLKKKELTLQTGDTWNSVWTSLVKTGLGKLTAGNREPRNWRPNIILFSGWAKNRPHL